MKRQTVIFILLIILFFILPSYIIAQEQSYSYYYFDKKITLNPSGNKFLVKFKDAVFDQQSVASNLNFSIRKKIEIKQSSTLYVLSSSIKGNSQFKKLKNSTDIEFVMPIFIWKNNKEESTLNQFIVKFKQGISLKDINTLNKQYGVKILKDLNNVEKKNRYLLGGSNSVEKDVFGLANIYNENSLVDYAAPDFIVFNALNSTTPDDTYYSNQWGLTKINAPQAWDISTGSSNIIVAVVDNGVDLTQEDLDIKIVQGIDFYDNDSDPQPYNNDYHGTACAGIIAAESNNGQGICGLSWGAKIMPIRMAKQLDYSYSAAAQGIIWAKQNNADVINCSFGGGSPHPDLTDAINSAATEGRTGKGSIVIVSAGNDDDDLDYPANLDNVIAVGATDENDNKWSYSNHGGGLDVVAPSGQTNGNGNIYTTDIMGTAGAASGNYYFHFGGTSAAAPLVSGLAALILSHDPSLTREQVTKIIEYTAFDRGTIGRDNDYGWGRIDAWKALDEINHTTTNGILPSDEIWYNTINITGDVTVPNGVKLTILSNSIINLGGYLIISTGGTIAVETGTVITGLAAKLKNGSIVTGLFPTVQGALNSAANGNTVEIQPGTFTENLTMPSGVTINGAGTSSTTVNGTVTFSNVSFSSLALLTVTNRINTIFSNNITLDNITAGSSSYFDISNSTAINITNIISSMPETRAIYSHSGSDFLFMGGTLNNKADAIHLQDNSYADIFQAYFCTNSSYDIVSFSSTANAYGCIFTSSTPGGSVYGDVFWSTWSSCGGGGGGGFFGAAKGTNGVSTVTMDDPAANEYALLMKSYRNVNDKVIEDKNTDKHSVVKNHDKEYRDLINKCKRFIKKYPGSKYTISLLYRISGVLLTLDDPGELSSYMQSIAGDSKLQNLKPYALTALVSKQIKTGNFRDAIDSYERLIKRYPSNSLVAEWLYGEGSVYKRLIKDRQKANEIFAQIIKDYPDSPTAQSAKNEMGSDKTGSLLAKKKQAKKTLKGFSADNYPNPFNPSTVIRFNIPEAGRVTLRIYDVLGREVRVLIDQEMSAGRHDVKWEGNNNAGSGVASGIYIYRLKYNNEVLNKKMLLLR